MSGERCFVCDKHRSAVDVPGGCIYRDDLVYASHGALSEQTGDVYLGTLFIEPRRHVAGLEDLTDDEAQRLGLVATRLARALRAATGAERIYSAVLGHHVPHLHLWLVARYPGTPEDRLGLDVLGWPQAPRGDADAIEALCAKLRERLT